MQDAIATRRYTPHRLFHPSATVTSCSSWLKESHAHHYHSMVGNLSKSPFLFLFVLGLITVVTFSALTFTLVTAWRYFRGRFRLQSSTTTFTLPTIIEGHSTPLDFSCRGPSRLGGISPML